MSSCFHASQAEPDKLCNGYLKLSQMLLDGWFSRSFEISIKKIVEDIHACNIKKCGQMMNLVRNKAKSVIKGAPYGSLNLAYCRR